MYKTQRATSKLATGKWGSRPNEWSMMTQKAHRLYSGTSTKRSIMKNNMIERVTEDIYGHHLAMMPDDVRKSICSDPKVLHDAIYNAIVPIYGELYVSPSKKAYDCVKIVGPETVLTQYKQGMPMWDFLKWFVLRMDHREDPTIGRALEEFSGIPIGIQREVYKKIVKFIHDEIKHSNYEECKTPSMVIKSDTSMTINVFGGSISICR